LTDDAVSPAVVELLCAEGMDVAGYRPLALDGRLLILSRVLRLFVDGFLSKEA